MGKSRIDLKIIDPAGATNMTGAAVVTSTAIRTDTIDGSFSVEPVWTGTPTGTFVFEDSDGYDPIYNPGATWNAVTPSPALVNPAGAAGQGIYTVTKRGKWFRMRYTNSGGSGSLTARAFGTGTV